MNQTVQPGLQASRELSVDTPRTIDFLGERLRVYATPALVNDVEWVCLELLREQLDGEHDSLGVALTIQHEAATPLGDSVRIEVEVTGVDRRMVEFRFSAHDRVRRVAQGTHTRAVVELEALRARVAARIAQ